MARPRIVVCSRRTAGATWAVGFYQRHGFRLVSEQEKEVLLRRYWSIPERQIEESVVLVGPSAGSLNPS
jgi:hypothetical protein